MASKFPIMNSGFQVSEIVRGLAVQFPILLVCLVAGVVILARWKHGSAGSIWALLGFGLALFLYFAIPVVQEFVRIWAARGGDRTRVLMAFTSLAVVWSVLRAVSYALLLVAVFAGRPSAVPAAPPPLVGDPG